ncbi:hypothetical protein KSC_108670 [Ktedonobacter sp. SOSP1-52]|uniref:hypothetical protein n=1 Tax=Ktedonobacter sp. SOSP1-52 TaxID=2778366 RepID=UPI001A2302D6|nr:hypothetical protein [Ktedonobacter sp. SOSP1-52]GHO71975.1 hypothetical protein KSC_108670 [Ktedonobacter sp. SOSP1-52]
MDWYGEGKRVLEICTGTALWYRSGFAPLPIRWILTLDPEGKRPPKAIFSTDPAQPAEEIIKDFMKRWSLEVTFVESRAHLGIESLRQWQGSTTVKPRQVSPALLKVGAAPLLWRDWGRRQHRRACMLLLHGQRVNVYLEQPLQVQPETPVPLVSRAQRAHARLSWAERLARNTRGCSAATVAITLFGVPLATARVLGLKTV